MLISHDETRVSAAQHIYTLDAGHLVLIQQSDIHDNAFTEVM